MYYTLAWFKITITLFRDHMGMAAKTENAWADD